MIRPAVAETPIEDANAEWVEVIADLSSDLANWRLQHLRGLWRLRPPAPGGVARPLARPELLALEGELADQVFEHGHADAWLGRNAHRAVWIHGERLTDDLCPEVARRRGDVAGQAEIR